MNENIEKEHKITKFLMIGKEDNFTFNKIDDFYYFSCKKQ